MKRVLVLLAAIAACLAVAGSAQAQDTQATVRISWDNCDPQVVDKVFGAAGPYTMVLSATNFTPGAGADDNVGHDTNVDLRPYPAGSTVPDAWRFDDIGCQTGSYLTYSTNAVNKSCPSLKGLNSLTITNYYVPPAENYAAMRLAITYDTFSPPAATRHTMWQVIFDHTYSVAGATNPGTDCGGVEVPMCIGPTFSLLLTLRGVAAQFGTQAGDTPYITWNTPPTCDGVPSVPSTWGKVKGLYR